ncbi:MAG: alpha/beta hydrolase [Bacteroidota bacterium]
MKLYLKKVILCVFFLSPLFLFSQELISCSTGKINRFFNFKTNITSPHTVDVWLPEDYSSQKKYAVVYMQDGQMLFDSTTTWNKQELKVDETVSKLIAENKIIDCIVVGIHNREEYRYADYFPEDILQKLSEEQQNEILNKQLKNSPSANTYLRFIAEELKPFIDTKYSTYTNKEHTLIMGSSMGGIISLYAMCKYPDVFGKAGCISTHWPVLSAKVFNLSKTMNIAEEFRKYISEKIDVSNHSVFYFDHGDKTLDSLYAPYQQKVDSLFKQKGFTKINFVSKKFPGDDHSEKSWSKRLYIPFEFLLRKEK